MSVENGAIAATYQLSKLPPDPTVGALPTGYKGVYTGAQVGTVSALVPTTSGHVLAFRFTGFAAAVTDLMTGGTTAIPGYSRLGAAARTPSGNFLVLAWDAQHESRPIRVLSLDPTSYRVTYSMNTGFAATHRLRDTLLPGHGHDAILAISRGTSASNVALNLWTITDELLTRGPDVPHDAGLTIATAGTDRVYVYGGPANNKVGLLNLTSGSFTPDVKDLQTPNGSYIVGILP